jgi:Protein of unknown function (DUF2914)
MVMHRIVVTLAPLLLSAVFTCAADPPPRHSRVIRTQFTTAIEDQEPVDNLTELNSGTTERIYCFTELTGLAGQVVTHRWEYRGEVTGKIRFHVKGPHSRVWSSRLLTPDRPGSWTVIVMTASGKILAERTLDYNLDDPGLRSALPSPRTTISAYNRK